MVPASRQSDPMVQVRMVMVLVIQPLMPAGAICGFAEALVLAEGSVAAEAGGFGGSRKLAVN